MFSLVLTQRACCPTPLPAAAAAAAIDKLKKQIDQWLRRSLQNCQLDIPEVVFRSDRSISPRLYFEKQV